MAKEAAKLTDSPLSCCLLLCRDVMMSALHGGHILNHIVAHVTVPELPATIGPLVAYMRMSNVHGKQEIRLKLQHVGTDDLILELGVVSPPKNDPLGVDTVIMTLPPFTITEAGRYVLQAWHNDTAFIESPLLVSLPEKRDEEN